MTALPASWSDVRGPDALEAALAANTPKRVELEVDLGDEPTGALRAALSAALELDQHRWLITSRAQGNALLRAWDRIPLALRERVEAARHVALGLVCRTALDALGAAPCLYTVATRRVLVLEPRERLALDEVLTRWQVGWVLVRGILDERDRALRLDWFDRIQWDCRQAGVPLFFEHWGRWAPYPVYDNRGPWALHGEPLLWGTATADGRVLESRAMPKAAVCSTDERVFLGTHLRSLVRGQLLREEPEWWR